MQSDRLACRQAMQKDRLYSHRHSGRQTMQTDRQCSQTGYADRQAIKILVVVHTVKFWGLKKKTLFLSLALLALVKFITKTI